MKRIVVTGTVDGVVTATGKVHFAPLEQMSVE
jgi:hypothetical protein